ncbi:MAG: alpha/beta fold hydrolase [Rubrimonas sp.]
MAEDAPFGPGARLLELRADDGARLRGAIAPASPEAPARGLLLLFQGRTECLEKYAPVVPLLTGRGFTVASVDWRGQGASEHFAKPRSMGHVGDFAEFQRDLAALLGAVGDIAGPRVLLAHSMGGAIALRALERGLDVRGAVFNSPMWGLAQSAPVEALGRVLSRIATRLGMSKRFALGGDATPYILKGYEGNLLTSDAAQFARFVALLEAHPELGLGGPSWGWARAAYDEMDALRPIRPPVPHLVTAGSEEAVVSLPVLRAKMGAELVVLPGGRHETMFETETLRAAFWEHFDGFMARIGV